LENIRARDKEDSERAIAPLRKADDALLIDTSNQNIEEVFQTLLSHFV
jgi:cytidylate kinase